MIGGTPKGLCDQPYCRNRKPKRRRQCWMHVRRAWRKAHPMLSAFRALKDHARARGIPFRLSFQTFRKFALQSDYLNRKGSNGHCLTVDRIDNLKGYQKSNIQPLTRVANAIKQAKRDAIRQKAGHSWTESYPT